MELPPYISFHPFLRREEWTGHQTKRAVREAVQADRGRGHLQIFKRSERPVGTSFGYDLVPADEWDAVFAD